MVHIPVLKIDVPDPDISALIPATITLAINALTAIHDAVDDFLHPLSPEAQAVYDQEKISALPREVRKARKRIRERRVQDVDKQSSEIEEAAFAFYRRMIRTNWVGYSDEDLEDTTFRRMVVPDQPAEEVQSTLDAQLQAATEAAGMPLQVVGAAGTSMGAAGVTAGELTAQQDEVEAANMAGGSAAGALQQHVADVSLPSRTQRAVFTSAAGTAGMVLGVGLMRLVSLLARARSGGRQRGRRTAGPSTKGAQRRTSAGSNRVRMPVGGGGSGRR